MTVLLEPVLEKLNSRSTWFN